MITEDIVHGALQNVFLLLSTHSKLIDMVLLVIL